MAQQSPHNVKLTVAYDGTNYLGWQKNYLGPSIEESLQKVLERILQHQVILQAASRTDAGVHASGQVVNFLSSKPFSCEKLLLGVNALLPKEIRVLEIIKTYPEFHPTLDCVGKTYHYEICQGIVQQPQNRLYSWHIPQDLNLCVMREAATFFVGTHDFSAFCNAKNNEIYKNKIRQIEKIEFLEVFPNRVKVEVKGKNFLYKMVRNIIGTLVYVGLGKIQPNGIPIILKNGDRTKAGVCAPSHGLTLFAVHYPESTKIENKYD